ncbi:glycosyltransferase family 9 protein [Granulicella sibirica]|uniref:Lipopolysaccharide heptosyltransferase I n=1 Tax=Granulicella sibirica TaxID=2479048 RepID=A0A4Q0T4V1_9BACT|nr:glycosyltransferase family 9 protein [Granulicella sibirica]RXH57068.1 Lipopolysaccharide heptosyltransferase I [Granulicella sibirica]
MNASGQMRVLIVRVGAMGDVLHAMPAVAGLRKAHPDWRIDWALEPRWRDLLVAEGEVSGPLVDSVIPVRTREWKRLGLSAAMVRDVLGLRRTLREGRYDVCVDLQGSVRSGVIGWMAGAQRFVGAETPRERPARFFYGETVRVGARHVIEQGCELVEAGVGERILPGRVELPRDSGAEAWCDGVVGQRQGQTQIPFGNDNQKNQGNGKGLDLGRDGRFVVMAPGAGWGAKEWPVERFGEVAARLSRDGWRVFVNAEASGGGKAEAVVRASGGAAMAVPCTIAELIALLRRASLFIGGDTGPMHLADALGVPVVALFGPTDPARNGPYVRAGEADRVRVLRRAESRTDHRRHAETEVGLGKITADEVTEAALELLKMGEAG